MKYITLRLTVHLPKKKDLKYMSLGLGISFANAIEKTKEKKLQKKEEKEKAITEWEYKLKKYLKIIILSI